MMRWLAFVALILVSVSPAIADPEPAVIDILVLYTPKVEQQLRAKYNKSLTEEIKLVEALQNRIFENSRVPARVKLTPAPFAFDEDKELGALKYSPHCARGKRLAIQLICYFAETVVTVEDRYKITKLRLEHKADLVSIWMWLDGWHTSRSASQLLTKHYYNGGLGAEVSARYAFLTLISAERAWHELHFAHEIGHNFGLADDAHTEDRLINADAHGYVDIEYPFRTIMASRDECHKAQFSDCPRIPVYSTVDPEVTFFGRPVGRAGHSNAAKTLRLTAPFVASYDGLLLPKWRKRETAPPE